MLSWLAELMKHRDASDSKRYHILAKKFIEKYGIEKERFMTDEEMKNPKIRRLISLGIFGIREVITAESDQAKAVINISSKKGTEAKEEPIAEEEKSKKVSAKSKENEGKGGAV